MSLLLRSTRVLQRVSSLSPSASYSSHAPAHTEDIPIGHIGNREVVGYGMNGTDAYADRGDFPLPAIRFKAPTPEILALREKEKGDWKKLTIQEKKQLYRASFCQTLAEVDAPTGEWKSILGGTLACISMGIWLFLFIKMFALPRELPVTCTLERRQAQLKRMIDMSVDPIEGLSSKWDYEKGDWKK